MVFGMGYFYELANIFFYITIFVFSRTFALLKGQPLPSFAISQIVFTEAFSFIMLVSLFVPDVTLSFSMLI